MATTTTVKSTSSARYWRSLLTSPLVPHIACRSGSSTSRVLRLNLNVSFLLFEQQHCHTSSRLYHILCTFVLVKTSVTGKQTLVAAVTQRFLAACALGRGALRRRAREAWLPLVPTRRNACAARDVLTPERRPGAAQPAPCRRRHRSSPGDARYDTCRRRSARSGAGAAREAPWRARMPGKFSRAESRVRISPSCAPVSRRLSLRTTKCGCAQ